MVHVEKPVRTAKSVKLVHVFSTVRAVCSRVMGSVSTQRSTPIIVVLVVRRVQVELSVRVGHVSRSAQLDRLTVQVHV